MKRLLACCCLFAASAPAFAGEGTTAADFINMEPAARASAMGGARTAVADGAFSYFHNPASLSAVNSDEVAMSHVMWLEGMSSEFVSFAHPLDEDWTVAAGANYFSSGKLDAYADSFGSASSGDYSYTGIAAGAALAWRRDALSLGATAKYIYESMDNNSAGAPAVDFGAVYSRGPWSLGAALLNSGAKVKLYESSSSLPQTLRLGASLRVVDAVLLAADFEKIKDSQAKGYAGAEWRLKGEDSWDYGYLRAGYAFKRETDTGSGLTLGAGADFSGKYSLDYAYASYGDLDVAHHFSLRVRFGDVRSVLAPEENATPDIQTEKKAAHVSADRLIRDYRTGRISAKQLREGLRQLGEMQ